MGEFDKRDGVICQFVGDASSGPQGAGYKIRTFRGKTKAELATITLSSLVRAAVATGDPMATLPGAQYTLNPDLLNMMVVTATSATAHGLAIGSVVTITGASAGYNGTFTVTGITSPTVFTYNQPGQAAGTAGAAGYLTSIPPSKRLMIHSFTLVCDGAAQVIVFDDVDAADDQTVTAIGAAGTGGTGKLLLTGSFAANAGISHFLPVPFGVSPGKRLSIKSSASTNVGFTGFGHLVDV